MRRLVAEVPDAMGPVAAIAQSLAGPDRLDPSPDIHLELTVEHRQALDRAARVSRRFEHSAGIRLEIVPLQPVHRLQPAGHGEATQSVVRDEDRRRAAPEVFDKGPVLAPLQDRLDRYVERMGEPPDRGQSRVGLIALDLRDDRFGDPGLCRKIGERKPETLAQPLDGPAKLVRQ